MQLYDYQKEIIGDIDIDEFVSFIANELDGGAIQALFTFEQHENGKHYDEARLLIQQAPLAVLEEIVSEFKAAA